MTTYMPHIANDMKVKIEMTEQEKLALLFLPASKGTLKQTSIYLLDNTQLIRNNFIKSRCQRLKYLRATDSLS